jgi:predicted RNA-binding Zn ribbon-like protein
MPASAAPGCLELVRDFVNTLDVEDGIDELSSPDALRAWLRSRRLLHGAPPSKADLVQARKVREALRALMLANNGLSVRKEAALTLSRAAQRADLALRFEAGGVARLEARGSGVDAALGRILAVVSASMAEGTWTRLKACRAEDCHWAFYDHARNRSRHWCSMAVCGNRAKARIYRGRHAA